MSLADRYRARFGHQPKPDPHPDDDTDLVALIDELWGGPDMVDLEPAKKNAAKQQHND